jgi:hypothetical protein
MSLRHIGHWARYTVWCTLAAMFALGCNPLATVSFLTQSDPVKPAEFPLTYDKGPKKDKEVVVALFVSCAPGISPSLAGSEGKLASDMAKKLPEMAKAAKRPTKMTVVEPSQVNTFKMKNPNWKQMHPSEWGKKLNADFVMEIRIEKMSLYKSGNLSLLYEGEAEVNVDVYEVDGGTAQAPKYTYVNPFKWPHTGFLASDSIPESRFKQDFLEHLAMELCMKHVEHKQASGIAEEK